MRRAQKTIKGKGKLFQSDREIATVSYSIQRWQDVTMVPSLSGASSDESAENDAQGTIQVLGGDKYLPVGESCLLVEMTAAGAKSFSPHATRVVYNTIFTLSS